MFVELSKNVHRHKHYYRREGKGIGLERKKSMNGFPVVRVFTNGRLARRQDMSKAMRTWLTIILIALVLLAVAIPTYKGVVQRSRESVLRSNLVSLRTVIKDFTKDKRRAPQSLQELVEGGYYRDSLPWDPITDSTSSWRPVVDANGGITDVRSGSASTSSNGTSYQSW
jgi:general secretion pathway protein G